MKFGCVWICWDVGEDPVVTGMTQLCPWASNWGCDILVALTYSLGVRLASFGEQCVSGVHTYLLVTASLYTFSLRNFQELLYCRWFDHFFLFPLRYFNEMSAQGLRPRTVSSPIPYTPSPSSSRPISPGECIAWTLSGWGLTHWVGNAISFPSSI